MKAILEPLAELPGVRLALLVTRDGVPVVVPGLRSRGAAHKTPEKLAEIDALSALAAGWLDELSRAVAPLSWDPPRRVLLRAVRGSVVLLGAGGAVLLVVLEPGLACEDLRLPMEGVAARIQRQLRGLGSSQRSHEPAAPLPQSSAAPLAAPAQESQGPNATGE